MALAWKEPNELFFRSHPVQLARSLHDAVMSIQFVSEALGDGKRCLPQVVRHTGECREAQSRPKSMEGDSL